MHEVVDKECRVLWTAYLAILVALTQVVYTQCIAELICLHEQLGSILAVDKDDVVDPMLCSWRRVSS